MRAVIYVRYATGWHFDASQSAIKIGSLSVPVSSPKSQRIGAWWLRRLDESTWIIAAHKFGTDHIRATPIFEAWGRVSVVLTGTPESVSEELELV